MSSSILLYTSTPQLSFTRRNFRCALATKTPKNPSNSGKWLLPGHDNPRVFVKERLKELAHRQQAMLLERRMSNETPKLDLTNVNFVGVQGQELVDAAYDRCHELFLVKNSPFALGVSLMDRQKQKGLWAIWAWGRRLDETVDGVNYSFSTHEILDRIEERLTEVYEGRPRDIYDVALADTVARFPVDIQVFKDVLKGVRFDMGYTTFENFDEHYLYRYYSGSAFLLQLVQVMGLGPMSTTTIERVYDDLGTLGIALTLVDMIIDIEEDANIGRIYISKDELELAGVSKDDFYKGQVTENWRNLMREQIKRARMLLDESIGVINELHPDVRWGLWTSVLFNMQDLKALEDNDYDCFSNKGKVGKLTRIASLPFAYAKSLGF